MIFHKPRQVVYDNELLINDRPLQRVTNTRFLGVTVQENQCWKLHCNYICNKISKYMHLFYRIRNYVSVESLKLLYFALLYPHMTYCNTVWLG